MIPVAGPASRQTTAARRGTRRHPLQHNSRDSLELVTHVAALFSYYREQVLPSPVGTVITGALAGRAGRFSKLVRTGDLEHVVDRR